VIPQRTRLNRSAPREAVRRAVQGSEEALRPAQVLQVARQSCRSLTISTVHRNLALLLELDEIQAVHFPGQSAAYLCTSRPQTVQFCCDQCRRIWCWGADLEAATAMVPPDGSRLEGLQIYLRGGCAGCK